LLAHGQQALGVVLGAADGALDVADEAHGGRVYRTGRRTAGGEYRACTLTRQPRPAGMTVWSMQSSAVASRSRNTAEWARLATRRRPADRADRRRGSCARTDLFPTRWDRRPPLRRRPSRGRRGPAPRSAAGR